jgi:hypothetical protein
MTDKQKEAISIISKTSYINPSSNIFTGRIIEYDIRSANITMLYKAGRIDYNYYKYLARLPKSDREIDIGLIIRDDKSYYDAIKEGIIDAKIQLATANNLDADSIIRVANDAVYINSFVDLEYTKFYDGLVEFRCKSISDQMMKLNDLIIFSRILTDGNIDIDIKGISNYAMTLHQDYMLSFIANIIVLINKGMYDTALQTVSNFTEQYVTLQLPLEYYRELNSASMYVYKYSDLNHCKYGAYSLPSKEDLDINLNLQYLRELYAICIEQYKKTKR